jgi:hypothetical protein
LLADVLRDRRWRAVNAAAEMGLATLRALTVLCSYQLCCAGWCAGLVRHGAAHAQYGDA